MGLFGINWSSVDVTNVGVQEAMVNVTNTCTVKTMQVIKDIRFIAYRLTIHGDVDFTNNAQQVDINCMVKNQINVLTSQLWAIKNESSAAQQLLSAGNINISKIKDYNEFSNKIMESIHNEFEVDLDQTVSNVYINWDMVTVYGNVVFGNTGSQSKITAVFESVSEAVAALDAHVSNTTTAGATPLTWLTWVLLAVVVVLGIVALSYTLYKKYGSKGKTPTKKTKGGIASWFKSKKRATSVEMDKL
jgi:hypothetical protein